MKCPVEGPTLNSSYTLNIKLLMFNVYKPVAFVKAVESGYLVTELTWETAGAC